MHLLIAYLRLLNVWGAAANGPLQQDIPWGRWDRVIDIGGAYGSVLAAVLTQHPGMRGVLFDQQQVWSSLGFTVAHSCCGADSASWGEGRPVDQRQV
jgi:hypothetical protein